MGVPLDRVCHDAWCSGLLSPTAALVVAVGTFAGCAVIPGGADLQLGSGTGKGKTLPPDYVHPGGRRANQHDYTTLDGSLSDQSASTAAASSQSHDAESLEAELETLRLRLTAQGAASRSIVGSQ